jgi:transcriptional regulator with XRE-family HTH domain
MIAVIPGRRRRRTTYPTHPLRLWRNRYGITQGQLAQRTGLTQGAISHFEQYIRIPVGDVLEELRRHTGLPTDAFVRPMQFLREDPDFLQKYRPPAEEG